MAVVASAPGKVLMTGGYLVLERPNAGLVLSTNARFYAIVKSLYDHTEPQSQGGEWVDVKLTSPQLSRESLYKLSRENFSIQTVSLSDSRNPFVEYAVQYSVAVACGTLDKNKKDVLHRLLLQGLDITILGCNDFYSYRNQIEARGLPLSPESLISFPPFASITFNAEESNGENCKPEVAKTGLGSSAAMTTAVVAALLNYIGVVNLFSLRDQERESDIKDLDMVHVIAQTAHCIAQGKVGSGFDVSSAVYGSQRYVRFSPEVLAIAQLLGEPGAGGSSTPSMVGAINKWKISEPQKSSETWKKLAEANWDLEKQLNLLKEFAAEQWDVYKCAIDRCSKLGSKKWMAQATEPIQQSIVKALLGARDAMLKIRYHMRQMGDAAGVPIEPKSQTELLDATMEMEGVLLGGVPGAGGFDAVFAITLGDSSRHVIESWTSLNVLALLVRENPRGVALECGDPRSKDIASLF